MICLGDAVTDQGIHPTQKLAGYLFKHYNYYYMLLVNLIYMNIKEIDVLLMVHAACCMKWAIQESNWKKRSLLTGMFTWLKKPNSCDERMPKEVFLCHAMQDQICLQKPFIHRSFLQLIWSVDCEINSSKINCFIIWDQSDWVSQNNSVWTWWGSSHLI